MFTTTSFSLYPELAASQMIQKWLQWNRRKDLCLILSLHFNINLQPRYWELRLGRLHKAFWRPNTFIIVFKNLIQHMQKE